MTTITVYGASDDLIEVEGDIREEFTYTDHSDEGDVLAFSDGTVLRIVYTNRGMWRIAPVAQGTGALDCQPAMEGDEDSYSDRVTLRGEVRWVVHGDAYQAVTR